MADARELIPSRPLIATGPFGPGLSAQRVASAIARGWRAGGRAPADLCPITPGGGHGDEVTALLDALDFNARMRRARAVILGEWLLRERALAGSAAFEIATRARQAGVPAYAVAGKSTLDRFDARILDLQMILQAHTAPALAAAGRKLAELI